ncbi:helix-turn-helix transcriptional regulator [Shewanella avicenniae]|uniref:Helix-turn-helix transcriptional regulator n=1 Tax=Shewanella avicenniae TaxID=2814294 RepID=A0ABX7QPQ4_9GAMM|nr:AraC family transcriptional regulator [Shewanella avicenniae]QSX32965.1 helix-turn-helix transcriptional regulator [Shewanella avicenniae]
MCSQTMFPQYSKSVVKYHINKLFEMGYSRSQIGQYCNMNIDRLLTDDGYFQSKIPDLYKIIKLLHESDYHKQHEILDMLEMANKPSLFSAYLLNSKNAVDLLKKLCQFTDATYQGTEVEFIDTENYVELKITQHPLEASFSTTQGFLFFVCIKIETLLQKNDVIAEVGSNSETLPDIGRFSQYVKTQLRFNQAYSYIRLDKETALQSVLTYNPRITEYLENEFLAEFPKLNRNHDIKELIIEDMLQAIQAGNLHRIFNIDYVCSRYGLSRTTLYRRLQDAETSFSEITQELRQSESKKLLISSFLSLNEISERLGYANLSAFNRAFKRWYGVSPATYRKSH